MLLFRNKSYYLYSYSYFFSPSIFVVLLTSILKKNIKLETFEKKEWLSELHFWILLDSQKDNNYFCRRYFTLFRSITIITTSMGLYLIAHL